jgi:hypothetical protein
MGDTKPSERIRAGAKELGERVLRPGGRAPSKKTRRRAVSWGILAGLVTLLLVLAADAALSSRHALAQIKAARDDLINGSTSVVSGDPQGSVSAFQEALAAADAAGAAANHPGLRILDSFPVIGSNVDAVKAVALSERSSALAGLVMARAAKELNWETFALPAVHNLGHVDLAAIRAATPKIDKVALLLHDAFRQLQAADSSHLVGPVATGYQESLGILSRRASLAVDADNLFHLLPSLLGGNQEQRYLVAVGSLAQPYGPGGRVGPLGVLTADQGTLRLNPLAPSDRTIATAAATPDFPDDATAMLAAAKAQGEGALNGVIMVDTQGLADLLWMVGDVKSTSWPTALSWANAGTTLDGSIFSGTVAGTAQVQQAALASDVMDAVLARHPSTEAFGTAMARAVGTRHLMIYSKNPLAQQLLSRLGATGRFVHLDNPVGVAWNTVGAPRTGALTRRSLTVGVVLDAHGTATMHTTVDLENRAPDTPPSVLLGPADGINPVGSYTADVGVYLPPASQHVTVETSSPSITSITKDGGIPVATGRVTAISGGSMSMLVTARVEHAAQQTGAGWVYRVRIVPQAAALVDPLHVRITIPTGLTVLANSAGMNVAGDNVTFSGTTARPIVLMVSYR